MLKKIGVRLVVVGVLMVGMGISNTAFVKPVHAGGGYGYNSDQAKMGRLMDNCIRQAARR